MSHKYFYRLYDASKNTYPEMFQGNVFSKEEAESWVLHNPLGSYNEMLLCKLSDQPCSEYCDLNIQETKKTPQNGSAGS